MTHSALFVAESRIVTRHFIMGGGGWTFQGHFYFME